MTQEVEYNGTTYRWSGDRWIDAATYMPPPGVVQQALNHRFGHQVQQPAARTRRRAAQSRQSKGIQQTI